MSFVQANRQVIEAARQPKVWLTFAAEDLRERYKRSVIGILWIPLSFLAFVGVKILVFFKLNGVGLELFTLHVVLGYCIWQTISATVADACQVFTRAGGMIKSSTLPYSIYVFQAIFRNSVTFGYNMVIAIAICIVVTKEISPGYLWLVPAYIIYVLNAVWVSLLLGSLVAKSRDIGHFMTTLMRVMFFVTPIIWVPGQLGELGDQLTLYNPLAHLISLVREPVMTGQVPVFSWIFVGIMTVLGWIIGLTVYGKQRKNLVFWV